MGLSGNGLVFKLATDNMYSSAGSYCSANIVRNGSIAVDETIVFAWGDNSITFRAKTTPDSSGTQITAGGSAATHYAQIAANFLLSQDFYISLVGSAIMFQSREKSADQNLTITSNTTAYTATTGVAGTSPTLRENFRLIVKTISGSEILGVDKIVPDLQGEALVNVADYVKDLIDVDFQFPQTTGAAIIVRAAAKKAYQIRYAEAYGSTLAVQALQTSEEYFALAGELGEDKLRAYYQFGESFWSRMSTSMNFLSWHPLRKLITLTSPEKLYFPVWYTPTGHTYISLKCYFTDGTEATVTNYLTFTVAKYDVLEIQCGYYALSLADYMASHQPTKTLRAYDLWLTANSAPVSETRHFDIDTASRPWERTFLFKNSLGVYEIFRSTGKATRKIAVTRDIATIDEPIDFTPEHRAEFQTDHSLEQLYEVNSGYFRNIESVRWAIDEFLGSDEVYEIRGADLIPVIVETESAESDTDGDARFFFKFAYRITGSGNVITSDESQSYSPGEYSIDYQNDYTI
jgi:hypothetical protein